MLIEFKEKIRTSGIIFYFLYFIGGIGYFFAGVRGIMEYLTPAVLFLTSMYVLLRAFREGKTRKNLFLVWIILLFVVTMAMEIMGVKHSVFFGEYEYGNVLGISFMDVPLIIGVNWIVVVAGTSAILRKFNSNPVIIAIGAGVIAVFFDIILEPAAIALGYWDWAGPIPLKNYITWFLITFIFAGIYGRLKLCSEDIWTPHLLGAQFLFFVIVRSLMLSGIL